LQGKIKIIPEICFASDVFVSSKVIFNYPNRLLMKNFNLARKLALPVILSLFSFASFAQNGWINEIHYDNYGGDVGEFIEVVIQDAGDYSMDDFAVVLYNGSASQRNVYNTRLLSTFTAGETVRNFTFFYFNYPVDGIQNGAPDGLALVCYRPDPLADTVLQFLSYEGSFLAANGPAVGMTSQDILVKEDPAPQPGTSLILQGEGNEYSEFIWAGPNTPTSPGQPNFGQTMLQPVYAPLADWALALGLLLIGLFAFIRIRKNS